MVDLALLDAVIGVTVVLFVALLLVVAYFEGHHRGYMQGRAAGRDEYKRLVHGENYELSTGPATKERIHGQA
jgi:hypothetical protein